MKLGSRRARRPSLRVSPRPPDGVQFDAGIAFSRAARLARRGAVPFLMIGFIVFLPLLLLSVCVQFLGGAGTAGVTIIYYLFSIISILFGILLAAPVSHGVAQLYQERPVRAGECLNVFISRWTAALPAVFMTAAAVGFTFAICLVPALLLFLQLTTKENPSAAMESIQTAAVAGAFLGLTFASAVWARFSVAIPSAVLENKSASGAIARSRDLTGLGRANIAILGAAGIFFCLLTGGAAFTVAKTFFNEREQLWIRLVLSEAACILPATFFAILAAVIHQELAREEAGAEISKITSIFE